MEPVRQYRRLIKHHKIRTRTVLFLSRVADCEVDACPRGQRIAADTWIVRKNVLSFLAV